MWKLLTKSVREVLEKSLSTSRSVGCNAKGRQPCSRICPTRNSALLAKKVDETTDEYGEPNEKQSEAPSYKLCESWLAFSYGSAVALGWFIVHPVCHLKKLREWNNEKRRTQCHLKNYAKLHKLLSRLAITQPLQIAYTNLNGTVTTTNDSESVQFGPRTADEALEEAAEGLKIAHDSLLGEVENLQGVDCIHQKKNKEAVRLFMAASKHGYAPAAYNLAQCYELGIGLKQDFQEASKWYKVAADAGHPGALYNLGVYYAHGWGGLKASSSKARELFTQAASLGQLDAIAALGTPSIPDPEKEKSDAFLKMDESSLPYIEITESGNILQAAPQDFILKMTDVRPVDEKPLLISYAVGVLAELLYQPKVRHK